MFEITFAQGLTWTVIGMLIGFFTGMTLFKNRR